MAEIPDEQVTVWTRRADALLEQALSEHRSGIDSRVTLSAVDAVLSILEGETPPDELDGYPFPGETCKESLCTCPPGLVQRGGFTSTCPAHGVAG